MCAARLQKCTIDLVSWTILAGIMTALRSRYLCHSLMHAVGLRMVFHTHGVGAAISVMCSNTEQCESDASLDRITQIKL